MIADFRSIPTQTNPIPLALLKREEEELFTPNGVTDVVYESELRAIKLVSYKKGSLKAVYHCVEVIRQHLAKQEDPLKLFPILLKEMSQWVKKLTSKNPSAAPLSSGIPRKEESVYFTGLGENTNFEAAGLQLHALFTETALTLKKKSAFVQKKPCTFIAQIWTPEMVQSSMTELSNLNPTERSLAQKVDLQIQSAFDTTLASIFVQAGVWKTVEENRARLPKKEFDEYHQKAFFFVGRLLYTCNRHLEEQPKQIPLTTFVALVENASSADVETPLKLNKMLVSVQPPPETFGLLFAELSSIVKQIIEWDKSDRSAFDNCMADFCCLFLRASPFEEGSNWCLKVLNYAFYKFHGFKLVSTHPTKDLPHQANAQLYLDEFEKVYPSCFTVQPIPPAHPQQAELKFSGSERFAALTFDQIKNNLIQFCQHWLAVHNDHFEYLLHLAMTTHQIRKKMPQGSLCIEEVPQIVRLSLLNYETSLHRKLKENFEQLAQMVNESCENRRPLDATNLIIKCLEMGTNKSSDYRLTIFAPYKSATDYTPWLVDFKTIWGAQPNFLTDAEDDEMKQCVKNIFRSKKFIFPVDHIVIKVLAEADDISKAEMDMLQKKTREEEIQKAEEKILVEHYITPEGPKSFAYIPLSIGFIKNGKHFFHLIKVYSSRYPSYLPAIVNYCKAVDQLQKLIKYEVRGLSKLIDLQRAYNTRLDSILSTAASQTSKAVLQGPISGFISELEIKEPRPPKLYPPSEPERIISLPPQPPKLLEADNSLPAHHFKMKDSELYDVFLTIFRVKKQKICWEEVVKCFSALGFSITPKEGSIYEFRFESTSSIVLKEGAVEAYDKASKNFHEPHKPGRSTRDPLPSYKFKRLRILLESVGMNEKSVQLE